MAAQLGGTIASDWSEEGLVVTLRMAKTASHIERAAYTLRCEAPGQASPAPVITATARGQDPSAGAPFIAPPPPFIGLQ